MYDLPRRLPQILIGALVAILLSAAAAKAQDVTVTLRDVEPRPGRILISLQTEAQFMHGRGDYGQAINPPTVKGEVTVVFHNVAPGDYAMSAMHDENDDRQMQRSETGMPQEGYAMSHGGAMMGPPTFDVAKFSVGDSPVTISESMYYPWVPPAGQ